jgi:hypothetical protein
MLQPQLPALEKQQVKDFVYKIVCERNPPALRKQPRTSLHVFALVIYNNENHILPPYTRDGISHVDGIR